MEARPNMTEEFLTLKRPL